MKRYILLDTAPIPNNGGALCLYEYGEDYVIKLESGKGGQLMNTRMHGSEDALGELPCKRVAARPSPRVLIGGLGMGFTLASALKHLGRNASVQVVELVPGVIEWNRGSLGARAGNPLSDPRVTVVNEDVAKILKAEPRQKRPKKRSLLGVNEHFEDAFNAVSARACPESEASALGAEVVIQQSDIGFDAILLDIDNGPEGLTHSANNWLYSLDGLATCARALRPKGILAIWSASADRQFSTRLRKAGFRAEEVKVYAHGNKGTRHTIWICEVL